MSIRAVRPIDVAALRAFFRGAAAIEYTTHTWPKVQPESSHLPLAGVFGQALGRRANRGGRWVATDNGSLVGYVAARARCDGIIWDVEHLHATSDQPAVELLEYACAWAVEWGGRRVFVEVPAESDSILPARRAGFERYACSTLLRLSPPFKADKNGAFAARPRLRSDDHELFQLYNAAVPAPVRAVEAMTYEEWSSLHRGSKKWTPSLLGDRHQYVWELGSGLVGWLEVTYGQKSQLLEFMVQPRYESMLDRLIAYALTQTSEKAAVYATARDYQPTLVSALRRAGFAPVGEVEILVRQLAARAPEQKLVPAKLVGG